MVLSDFEAREQQRRATRRRAYDALAEARAAQFERRHYYTSQLHSLIGSLVMPGSRVLDVGCGLGDLLASLERCTGVGLDVSARMIDVARRRHPGLDLRVADVEHDPLPDGPFDVIILSDVVGHLDDVEVALQRVRPLLAPTGRLIVTYYSFLWEPALKLAEMLGLKTRWPDQNWLSMKDISNLLGLADFEVVRSGTDVLLPAHVPVVSELVNHIGAKLPGLREGALVDYFVARVAPPHFCDPLPSVSVICPCKDEKGNIREAVARTPVMGPATELIFVDGNSKDGTREEILAVMAEYKGP